MLKSERAKSDYKRRYIAIIYINKNSQIMTKFLPSKWGHTLDDKEFTLMLEPYPGTQVIYEHFSSDCPTNSTTVHKTYPPNTTLILNNPC